MGQEPQLFVFRLLHKTNSQSAKSCYCPAQIFAQVCLKMVLSTCKSAKIAEHCSVIALRSIPLPAMHLVLGISHSDKHLAQVHQTPGLIDAGGIQGGSEGFQFHMAFLTKGL